MRLSALLLGAVLTLSGAATAAEEATLAARHAYRIEHAVFGELGEHVMTIRRHGEDVEIEHTAELAVRVLGITMFTRSTRFRELWREGRLIVFDGRTIDNDEPFEVRGRAEGDSFVIEGSAGRVEAPAEVAPSEPSLIGAIEREWFFDIKTGELLRAEVRRAGTETLALARGAIEAVKYEVRGELEQDVWFDEAGVWVRWRLWRQGAAITLTRK